VLDVFVVLEPVTGTVPAVPEGTVSSEPPVATDPEDPPPPHAATPVESATPAASAASFASIGLVVTETTAQEPSGSIRLPQLGQSFRSF
jgi:hypothetical protein